MTTDEIKRAIAGLQIGESTLIPRTIQKDTAHTLMVRKIKAAFIKEYKHYQLKLETETDGVRITRIPKKVPSERYDLVYRIGDRIQYIYKGLPYVVARTKKEEYTRNPNYKVGQITIEPCK